MLVRHSIKSIEEFFKEMHHIKPQMLHFYRLQIFSFETSAPGCAGDYVTRPSLLFTGNSFTQLHRHRPQIAFPKKQNAFFNIHKATVLRIRKCSLTIDASGSEIMKGNKLGDKVAAAAKSSSKEKSGRGSGGQQQPTSEIMKGDKAWETRQQWQPRAAQNGDHEGRQAWKTSRQSSQEQPRMEIMKGDEGRWRETRRQRQPRAGQNGDREGRHMKRPFSHFGDRQPSHLEVRTPIASSYLGNEGRQMKAGVAKSRPEWRSWALFPRNLYFWALFF